MKNVEAIGQAHWDLNKLQCEFSILEQVNGQECAVYYEIKLAADREAAQICRTVISPGSGDAVEEDSQLTTLKDLCDDQSRDPVVVWLARGMWGIPMEYGTDAHQHFHDLLPVSAGSEGAPDGIECKGAQLSEEITV